MNKNSENDSNEVKNIINDRFDEIKGEIKEIKDNIRALQSQNNPQTIWKQLAIITTTILISSLLSGTIGILIGWLMRSGKLRLVIESRPI